MRKILAIGLIGLHLFGNTELGQIFDLPQLISHYHQHQKQNRQLGFFSFLIEHYCGDDGTTADDNEDMKLPFHNYHHACLSMTNIATVNIHPEIEHPDFPVMVAYGSFMIDHYAQHKTEVILQPPRPAC